MIHATYYIIYNKSINMYKTRNYWTHDKTKALKTVKVSTIEKHFNRLTNNLKQVCIITEL